MNVKMMQVGPLGTNCYILEDEKTREAAVIDPGGDAPEIIRALEGAKLRYILLTHGHYDHTGGAAELERAFPQAALYIHRKDLEDVDPSLFPLRTQIQGANLYDEGAWISFGEDRVRIQVLHTPGHSEGRNPALRGAAVLRGHPVCRLLRSDGFPRRQRAEDDGLPPPPGGTGGGPAGPARTHGVLHPGGGAAV